MYSNINDIDIKVALREDGVATLLRSVTIKVSASGENYYIVIFKGFKFDGASIPRWLWTICGHPFEYPRVKAALVHDWLYRSHALPRDVADEIFNRLSKDVGMSIFRTAPEWLMLRVFGRAAWESHTEIAEQDALRQGTVIKI